MPSFLLPLYDPATFLVCASILGALVGSFLNVVIHRLPIMMEKGWLKQCLEYIQWQSEQSKNALQGLVEVNQSTLKKALADNKAFNLFTPASCCPHCKHKIRPWQNIPVISYLFLKGKCSNCKHSISPRYPLIELITAILTGFTAWHFGFGLAGLSAFILIWALIALTAIDLDTQLLPDDITLPLLWLGLILNSFGTFTTLFEAITGAAAGYLALWLLYWTFKLLTGKEGMGYGDFKLLAALGAWLGLSMLPLIILVSSIAGALIGIGLIIFARHGRSTPIPFGPYLALGGLVALFWGQEITQQYLR